MAGDVEPCQRADTVVALWITHRPVKRELDVGRFFAGFAEVGEVLGGIESVGYSFSGGVDDADLAVVILESACGIHCREKERGEVAHVLDLFAEGIEERLEAIECDSH